MKNRLLILTLTIAALATTGLAGQSKPGRLQGVWRTVEVTLPGRTIKPSQPNLAVISARHYARVEDQSESPRPIVADATKATAEELRAVWGPFVAEAGTYELAGSTLTMRPLVSKNPAAMTAGAFIVYTCTVDGNDLTVTQQRNQNGPFANPATFKLVRVE